MDAETAEKLEIDKNISEFLSVSESYSDDRLEKILFGEYLADGSENSMVGELGIVDTFNMPEFGKLRVFQGIILGSYVNNGDVVILLGTKNYSGERIVLPVFVDHRIIKYGQVVCENVSSSRSIHRMSTEMIPEKSKFTVDMQTLDEDISARVGEPMLVYIDQIDPRYSSELKDFMMRNGASDSDAEEIMEMMTNNLVVREKYINYLNKAYTLWGGQLDVFDINRDTSDELVLIESLADLENFSGDYINKILMFSQIVLLEEE